jgi:hypothetical protein
VVVGVVGVVGGVVGVGVVGVGVVGVGVVGVGVVGVGVVGVGVGGFVSSATVGGSGRRIAAITIKRSNAVAAAATCPCLVLIELRNHR